MRGSTQESPPPSDRTLALSLNNRTCYRKPPPPTDSLLQEKESRVERGPNKPPRTKSPPPPPSQMPLRALASKPGPSQSAKGMLVRHKKKTSESPLLHRSKLTFFPTVKVIFERHRVPVLAHLLSHGSLEHTIKKKVN